jgi:SsrA-binding protein
LARFPFLYGCKRKLFNQIHYLCKRYCYIIPGRYSNNNDFGYAGIVTIRFVKTFDMAQQNNIVIKNKKASFDYEFIETFVAGIVLTGTEIKSVRLGKASLVDTYCIIVKRELWVKNMNISEYFYGSYNNHSARRDRKLLLNRKELNKIERLSKDTGFTVVPTKLFLNEKGLAKIVIAVAKGKKSYDKRQSLRERDDKRDIDRAFKK